MACWVIIWLECTDSVVGIRAVSGKCVRLVHEKRLVQSDGNPNRGLLKRNECDD